MPHEKGHDLGDSPDYYTDNFMGTSQIDNDSRSGFGNWMNNAWGNMGAWGKTTKENLSKN